MIQKLYKVKDSIKFILYDNLEYYHFMPVQIKWTETNCPQWLQKELQNALCAVYTP